MTFIYYHHFLRYHFFVILRKRGFISCLSHFSLFGLFQVVTFMSEHNTSSPSLALSDFLAAFGLDSADAKSLNIYHENGGVVVSLELNPKLHSCPVCNSTTSKIKGYHLKIINHSVLNPLSCTIRYRARRFICPVCGKTFYEKNPFVSGNSRASVATVYNVLNELKRPESTFTCVAAKYHMSASSVANIFDKHVQPYRRSLPECLCFDETYAFKSRDSDYICVLLDYTAKMIVDVLPSRRKRYLIDYFFNIPLKERKNVKYVSFDMWKTYREVAKLMFPNCVCIVDKFHVLQELSRKVNRVRIDVMNKNKKMKDELMKKKRLLKQDKQPLSSDDQFVLDKVCRNYYLLKKFDFVLFENSQRVTDPNFEKKFNKVLNRYCNMNDIFHLIMDIDPLLEEAVNLKDIIHSFYRNTSYQDAKMELESIIILCRTSNVKGLQEFSNTLCEWKQEIINSFIKIPSIDRKMNNALIENKNKAIKLLKHSSNGYTNWNRFRARVLYSINGDIPFKV